MKMASYRGTRAWLSTKSAMVTPSGMPCLHAHMLSSALQTMRQTRKATDSLSARAAMHDIDPAFRSYSRGSNVQQLLTDLGYKDPLPVQSMLFCKVRLSGS